LGHDVARLEPSAAHHDWANRLKEVDTAELLEHVQVIQEVANELGIWERGGYVPVQPFVVSAAANKVLHKVGAQLQDLLVSHALDNADGDLHRLADIAEWRQGDRWFLGANRPLSEALESRRSDVFVAGGRPQFLELNFGTCLNGATVAAVLGPALLKSPVGVEMRHAHGVRSGSFLGELVHWVRRHLPDDNARIALLAVPDLGDEGSVKWAEDQMVYFASHGIACDFVPVGEADVDDGTLTWRGRRYGGAVRYFMVTPKVADHLDFIIALEHATGTAVFGAYVSQLFTSKALLADLYHDERLTSQQRRLLDHVPWTARLRPARVRKAEERVDPVEWAVNNRERAVLKPSNLFGSRGVVVGHLTSETDWCDTVDAAVQEGGHVVQELVRPDTWTSTYWHIESETLVSVCSPVLLGPFVVDGNDAGCYYQQPITGTENDFLSRERDLSLGCLMSA
jgi:hypothetical protein